MKAQTGGGCGGGFGHQFRYRHRSTDIFLLALSVFTVALWLSAPASTKTKALPSLLRLGGGAGKSDGGKPELRSEGLNIVPIPRIPAGSLSVKEFFAEYGDRTVIVEGETREHPAYRLGFEGLRDLCGGATLETAVYSETAAEWAGLDDTKKMHLDEYLDNFVLSDKPGEQRELRYASGGMGVPGKFAFVGLRCSPLLLTRCHSLNRTSRGVSSLGLLRLRAELRLGGFDSRRPRHQRHDSLAARPA